MVRELAENFRPVAPPQLIDNAYTPDQHARLLKVVRDNGPWPPIPAENFKTPEEVIATVSGSIPEGVKLTWDMIGLNPVFRGYLARGGTCFGNRGLLLQQPLPRTRAQLLGLPVCRTGDLPVQYPGTDPDRRAAASRRHGVPRHDHGKHSALAAPDHGQVVPVQSLAIEKGLL
jgi:hypothetical protein